jgi:hypothetical protein
MMASVRVYRFSAYDSAMNDMVVSTRMATRQTIERLKVEGIVPATEAEIDSSLLDGNGMTARNFFPPPRSDCLSK